MENREQLFNEIVRQYGERLYWHIRTLTGSHEDTDDLLQEVYLKIWNALPSFRGEAQLYTWVYRIATNEALNFMRRQRIRSALMLESLPAAAERMVSADPYFDGDAAERKLSVAIASLPPRQRAVFCMRYYDDMSYEQMSEILGTSVGSLKASYHFAAEKIKLLIGE